MDEIFKWILIVIGISVPPLVAVCLDYYFKRKKLAAETKKIQLQNKITEEVTYEQLKTDNKHKDIKNKIEIFSRLSRLEEEIKNRKNKSASDYKKLEALELINQEFKKTFPEKETEKSKEKIATLTLVKEKPTKPSTKRMKNKKRKKG